MSHLKMIVALQIENQSGYKPSVQPIRIHCDSPLGQHQGAIFVQAQFADFLEQGHHLHLPQLPYVQIGNPHRHLLGRRELHVLLGHGSGGIVRNQPGILPGDLQKRVD